MTSHNLGKIAETFETLRSDYDMSRESRFVRRRLGLAPQGGSADYHVRNEYQYYDNIEKARDVDRNDSIIGQTIDRAVTNIVQEGFTLDPRTGDEGLDLELRERWNAWATEPDECDIQGEFCFHDFEVQALRSMFVDGDVVFLALESGEIQAVEGHAVRTTTTLPNTFLGVTLSEVRRRERYYIATDPINPNRTIQGEQSVPVDVRTPEGLRQVFHVFNPKRMTQTRGITALAPIFAVAGMRDDIDFAMLVQRQVASCFAIFRKRSYSNDGQFEPPGYGNSTYEVTSGGVRYIENIAPGMEVIGQPGEELTGFSPDIGGSGYELQLRTILQTIGVNLGLPLCLVLMDGSETNFSGWRGAVDEARKGFKANQRNLILRLHRPLYRFKVSQFLADDPVLERISRRSDVDVFSHKWNVPSYQYIEPVADAQGDALRLQNGLTSPRRLHAERGVEWDELLEEVIADNANGIAKAKKVAAMINEQNPEGEPVHWRELIPLPMPSGMQFSMSDTAAAGSPSDTAEDAGSGELLGAGRRDWQNVRKAITDLLGELASGTSSESRVRTELGMLGLSGATIDKLIADTSDGTPDVPEEDPR